MGQKVTLQQIEALMTARYKGKNCSYSYPGYKTVYGMVDEISVNTINQTEAVIIMGNKRYTCELAHLQEHLQLLKKEV